MTMRCSDLPSFLAPLPDAPRQPPVRKRVHSAKAKPRRKAATIGAGMDNEGYAGAAFPGADRWGADVLEAEAPDAIRWPEPAPEQADAGGVESEAATESGGSAVERKVLPGVRMVGQQASMWCWAAVTQTVNEFFDGASADQHEIATRHLSQASSIICRPAGETRINGDKCREGGCPAHCNNSHIVRIVLAENGHYDRIIANNRKPTFKEIADEIDAGRPVACRVAWHFDNSGHFILVHGWTRDADGKQWVHVLDPKQNEGGEVIAERILAFADFVDSYTLMGSTGSINYCYAVK